MKILNRSSAQAPAGFSLAELLAVITIIGILSAIAAPSMSGMLNTSRVNSAITEVQGDLARTRMEAVRRGRSASMRFTGQGKYQITIDADNPADRRTVKSVDLGADYANTLVSASSTPITFNSRGILQATADQVVTVQRGTKSVKLNVSSIGRISREY